VDLRTGHPDEPGLGTLHHERYDPFGHHPGGDALNSKSRGVARI
jgi:hypothetical protein